MGIGQENITGTGGIQFESDIATSWDGSLWSSPVDLGDELGFGMVSCASSESCLVVGGYHASGDVYAVWNGLRWSKEGQDTSGTGISPEGFESLSCSGRSFCLTTDGGSVINGDAASFTPPVTSIWNGKTWTPLPKKDRIEGGIISCATAAQYCVIVGSGRYFIGTG